MPDSVVPIIDERRGKRSTYIFVSSSLLEGKDLHTPPNNRPVRSIVGIVGKQRNKGVALLTAYFVFCSLVKHAYLLISFVWRLV